MNTLYLLVIACHSGVAFWLQREFTYIVCSAMSEAEGHIHTLVFNVISMCTIPEDNSMKLVYNENLRSLKSILFTGQKIIQCNICDASTISLFH